jgi:hypothetical protein
VSSIILSKIFSVFLDFSKNFSHFNPVFLDLMIASFFDEKYVLFQRLVEALHFSKLNLGLFLKSAKIIFN